MTTILNRRHFLGLAAASAGLGLVNSTSPAFAGGAHAKTANRIGVALYTLRKLMEKSVPETLALVAEVGFKEVETAGFFDHSPLEFRRMLENEGLRATTNHIALTAMESDFNSILETALILGSDSIILPWIVPEDRGSLDFYKRLVDKMNVWGEACQKVGLRFAYHNHDFEFQPVEGELPYDIILQGTDPDKVYLEMDLYWVTKAGKDPVELIRANPGRFPFWHVKDMASDGSITNLGDGVIDFQRIFAVAGQAGLDLGYIEHDTTESPEATIRQGLRVAQSFKWGKSA